MKYVCSECGEEYYGEDYNGALIPLKNKCCMNGIYNKGTKFDTDKTMYHLIPPECLEAIAEVFTHGANKYGEGDWQKGLSSERLYSSLMRHVQESRKGVTIDPESKLRHMAHAATNAIMMLWNEMEKE